MNYPLPHYVESFTSYSKDYPSMFSNAPLKLKEKEFLLYFGNYVFQNVQICLGYIKNSQFVPTDCFKTSKTTDIDHTNLVYPFVKDFIETIFYYRLFNKKTVLDQNDMEYILEEFGISRKQKLQTLVKLLKNMEEKSSEILLGNNNVEDVLKVKKYK